jgi:hypothetical protein
MTKPVALLLILMLGCMPSLARAQNPSEGLSERLAGVHLANGGDLNILISQRIGTKPTIAALLFPGYPGVLRLREQGGQVAYDLRGNFLVRARRHLNTQQIFTVLIDCPVQRWQSCDDRYRSSADHVSDIRDVVRMVKTTMGVTDVYIVGTSYGTVSTAFLARGLGSEIAGAVHTSTITDPGPNSPGLVVRNFDWHQTQTPQLFIHHKDDPCSSTRYSTIANRASGLPFITVEGALNPHGDPCEAMSQHGFVGRERAVMLAIADWISERRLTTPIVADRQ